MHKSVALVVGIVVLGFVGIGFADVEVVKTGYGSLTIGANFQVGFNWYLGDELLGELTDENGNVQFDSDGNPVRQAKDRESDMEFYLKRARLVLKGSVISEKVKYMLQLEGKSETGVQLADMKLGFKYIPFTTIWVGRYLPHFQYWTPINTGRLYLIDYPLMYDLFGVQRHIGLDIAFNHQYVDICAAIYNGHDYNNMYQYLQPDGRPVDAEGNQTLGNQDWSEENTAKDYMFSIDGKPIDNMHIFAGLWYGNPLDYFEYDNGDAIEHDAAVLAVNGGFGYIPSWGLRLWAEVFYSQLRFDPDMVDPNDQVGLVSRNEDTIAIDSISYYVRLGYNLEHHTGVPIEFLVQYDWLDPDMENNKTVHVWSDQDELTEITAGMNLYLADWHAMMYINYIARLEAWKDVRTKDNKNMRTGIENDELKVMWQVAF